MTPKRLVMPRNRGVYSASASSDDALTSPEGPATQTTSFVLRTAKRGSHQARPDATPNSRGTANRAATPAT